MIDVMGLSGDTADNIPGVPGIGPKTALKLIRTFGSMEGVYDRIETIRHQEATRAIWRTTRNRPF